ncbi:hypothetical protein ACU4GR_12165 [Methylobacterium oryzae CBMB20]
MSSLRKRVPAVTDWMGAAVLAKTQKGGVAGGSRNGSLYEPGQDGAVRGRSPHKILAGDRLLQLTGECEPPVMRR